MPSCAAAVGFIQLLLQQCDHVLCFGNVAVLAGLVVAAQCDYDGKAVFPAIDAVAWAAVNAKLDNITADWLAVAPVPQRQAGKSSQNLLLPNFVSQFCQPGIEIGGTEDLEHHEKCNLWSHLQNSKIAWIGDVADAQMMRV